MNISRDETRVKPYAAPLVTAIRQIESRLEREEALPVMVVAHTLEDVDRQEWPEHVTLTGTKPLRRRTVARVSRSTQAAATAYQILKEATLVFALSGRADMHFSDYMFSCRAGDCFFVPPGVPQFLGSHIPPEFPAGQCDLLWLRPELSGNRLGVWICHSHGPQHESGPERGACWVESAILKREFENLNDELQSEKDQALAGRFILNLLTLLRREMEQGRAYLPGHHLADHHQPLSANAHDPMESACSFIDQHLGQPLVESRVARYLCISPTLFRRRFREHTGGTFHEFLTARRLEKASTLLRETDIPIADISRVVGLHYSQFRRLYYSHYGCSPGEYRRKSKNGEPASADSV